MVVKTGVRVWKNTKNFKFLGLGLLSLSLSLVDATNLISILYLYQKTTVSSNCERLLFKVLKLCIFYVDSVFAG